MIMTKRKIIFATALALVLNGVNYTASANEGNKNSSSSKYLVADSSNEFHSFMNSKAKKFLKKNNEAWNTFNNVVNAYEASTGKFQNMNEAEKANFLKAAAEINAKLSTMKSDDAAFWLKKVNLTTAIYQFVWESKAKGDEIKRDIVIPEVKFERPLGR